MNKIWRNTNTETIDRYAARCKCLNSRILELTVNMVAAVDREEFDYFEEWRDLYVKNLNEAKDRFGDWLNE